MEGKMNRWGIGPLLFSLSTIYGLIILIVDNHFYPMFQVKFLPYQYFIYLATTVFIIGIPFFITSIITITRAYNANKLVTNGIFKFCRHPLYASWVVFIVPGIVLLLNSWIGFTIPIFMYIILWFLIRKEEKYLENTFGRKYLNYKKKVPAILPYGWLKSNKQQAR
jgi:protein-S-isoprenylcysteine O-methyltransferase Ste14